ncbi:MAG: tRNA epoxyqueuosine(34) reductase QueG [Chloroflexi bacterium]|nr:tRNA epoxyqueuosine(34) reductase QueG [Chloroflexota bacterium]
MDQAGLASAVTALCRGEGFDLVAFAPALPQTAAREAARARLAEGHLTGMGWITAEWVERATDPGRFLPGARTVILVALPCHAEAPARSAGAGPTRGRVARYAWGRDYHRVFESKLRRTARRLREEFGAAARATVDYGPLLERPLAVSGGLGWRGKSTMLLVPGLGPWVLLGAVATDLELPPGEPLRKSCGSCRRCATACPTGALGTDGQVLDARLCISYHTIENRGVIPRELRAKFGEWVFGCDDCLDSCPVGAARFDAHPDFAAASEDDAFPPLAALLALDEATFAARFRGRSIMRAKRDGLVRNACVALGNTGNGDDLPALVAALGDASAIVRGHAAWGMGRLATRLRDPGVTARAVAALEVRLATEDDAFVREELAAALAEVRRMGGRGDA